MRTLAPVPQSRHQLYTPSYEEKLLPMLPTSSLNHRDALSYQTYFARRLSRPLLGPCRIHSITLQFADEQARIGSRLDLRSQNMLKSGTRLNLSKEEVACRSPVPARRTYTKPPEASLIRLYQSILRRCIKGTRAIDKPTSSLYYLSCTGYARFLPMEPSFMLKK